MLAFESAAVVDFADGLAGDIITNLSKFGRFSLPTPQSSFAYKGKAVSVRQVAQELDVRYVVEGRVQWSGQRVRVSAQLSDAATGQQLWAERYKREGEDAFEIQDEIAETISASLAHKLDAVEAERDAHGARHKTTAYDCYIEGSSTRPCRPMKKLGI